MTQRKKTWIQKVNIVRNSFLRSSLDEEFAGKFYQNLFFLNPKLKEYFAETDFEHQEKALMHGLQFMFGYLDQNDDHARKQVLRIAVTHSKKGMNIHPHDYYYWIDALIMTAKECDPKWVDNMAYYWREVINMPVSFIISQYFQASRD